MSGGKKKESGQIFRGVVSTMAITALLCMIYALLIEKGSCNADNADIVLSLVVLISTAAGGIIASRGAERRLLHGTATGLIFTALIIAIPILAYPDTVSWLKILRIAALAVVGGAVGSILKLGKSNKKLHKSRKKRI